MAAKRQQLTFRGLQRRMERQERRSERTMLGRWGGLDQGQVITLTTTLRGGAIFTIAGQTTKTSFYSWDGALSLAIGQDTATEFRGQILGTHVREGQSVGDFWASSNFRPNLSSADWQTHARASKFLPVILIGTEEATRGGMVIPLSVLVPKNLVLKRNESYVVSFGLAGTGVAKISVQAHGRYRFVASA